jgi:hypothetical protein
MTDVKRNKKQILEKQVALRAKLWPNIAEEDLWSHRRKDGFTPIPRVMPLVLQIMDDLATRPVSSTYLDLWCRKWDEQFVTLNRQPREYAFFAGFSGQRGEQTWRERMRELAELGFIRAERGPHGDFSYVLIVNPIRVIEGHVQKKTPGLRKEYVNALLERANQVKARVLDDTVSPSTASTNKTKP